MNKETKEQHISISVAKSVLQDEEEGDLEKGDWKIGFNGRERRKTYEELAEIIRKEEKEKNWSEIFYSLWRKDTRRNVLDERKKNDEDTYITINYLKEN